LGIARGSQTTILKTTGLRYWKGEKRKWQEAVLALETSIEASF
jgi:hypothetical protein